MTQRGRGGTPSGFALTWVTALGKTPLHFWGMDTELGTFTAGPGLLCERRRVRLSRTRRTEQ